MKENGMNICRCPDMKQRKCKYFYIKKIEVQWLPAGLWCIVPAEWLVPLRLQKPPFKPSSRRVVSGQSFGLLLIPAPAMHLSLLQWEQRVLRSGVHRWPTAPCGRERSKSHSAQTFRWPAKVKAWSFLVSLLSRKYPQRWNTAFQGHWPIAFTNEIVSS